MTFTAAQLAYNLLHFAPYMFGSVVYRISHASIVTEWSYPYLHGYFDRHYLGRILERNDSKGVYLEGNGIFERDHSMDAHDERGNADTIDDALHLLAFYKKLLQAEYTPAVVDPLITNQALFFFSNFRHAGSLRSFYERQKPYHLIRWSALGTLGIISLASSYLSPRLKRQMRHVYTRVQKGLI
jgi:hypothetical protein